MTQRLSSSFDVCGIWLGGVSVKRRAWSYANFGRRTLQKKVLLWDVLELSLRASDRKHSPFVMEFCSRLLCRTCSSPFTLPAPCPLTWFRYLAPLVVFADDVPEVRLAGHPCLLRSCVVPIWSSRCCPASSARTWARLRLRSLVGGALSASSCDAEKVIQCSGCAVNSVPCRVQGLTCPVPVERGGSFQCKSCTAYTELFERETIKIFSNVFEV